MINLKLSSKRHLRRNRQSASQSTFASQSSKCVAIDKCVANVRVRRNRHLYAKCVEFPTSLRRNRHLRRKRQSASQSTNASQTSKCVAIDKCVANVKVRRNRQLSISYCRICLNRHFYLIDVCVATFIFISQQRRYFSVEGIQGKSCNVLDHLWMIQSIICMLII
jgi:hypothetical protein